MSGRALVVDDSLTIRMDLLAGLEAAGIDTVACARLADARAALEEHTFALVLLDVQLPDGDGVDLLPAIRGGASARAHVVMFSSEAAVRHRVRGISSGADEYLAKPYDLADIVHRARRHCLGPAEPSTATPTVLVIDDRATFRAELGAALRAAGYDVLEASDGEHGLRLASAARPAAMIVDRVLPGIDGPTVIRRIRLDPTLRTTPCVLLTGSGSGADELDALEAGADGFAHKQADLDVVLARLAAVLRGASASGRRSEPLALRKRILAVDDSPTYLQELRRLLEAEGYEVVDAPSGEQALELLAVQPVDCILLDVVMPGLGGRETCARIKGSPLHAGTPLLMLTGIEDRDTMLGCLVAGADDFLSKTAEPAVIRARVRAQLRRSQYEQEARAAREELLARHRDAAEAEAARALAEVRAQMADELARKNEELEAFSYSVSHDLRAPLRGIEGFARILQEDYQERLDEEGREHLDRILHATHRMAEIIDDLLALARTTRADLSPASVDVSALAERVVADLRARDPERRVEVTIDRELVVRGDPRLLRVVLENLLGNAWKFTRKTPHPHIEVRAHESGFLVRDDGAGFDMAHAGKLFQAFRRLHLQREFEGTGVGLATVRRIVERHGGQITVEAAPGRGATFRVSLPTRATHVP